MELCLQGEQESLLKERVRNAEENPVAEVGSLVLLFLFDECC